MKCVVFFALLQSVLFMSVPQLVKHRRFAAFDVIYCTNSVYLSGNISEQNIFNDRMEFLIYFSMHVIMYVSILSFSLCSVYNLKGVQWLISKSIVIEMYFQVKNVLIERKKYFKTFLKKLRN